MADEYEPASLLAALRTRLDTDALRIALPLSADAFDEVVASTGGPRARDLLDGAAGLVLLGDGGAGFFARFRDAAPYTSGADNPLDDFTRACVGAALDDVLRPRGLAHRVRFPFDAAAPLPFQRLGQAAGLPAPGPLGLQIHPEFGPWWAYRALVVLPVALEAEATLLPWCPPCDQPCVDGCPTHPRAQATRAAADDLCSDECGARARCPVGREHAYPADQIAFHLRARHALLRARSGGAPIG